jgi:antitoxin component of RelBE/YafQ-DinJ toxin-antitoxin module
MSITIRIEGNENIIAKTMALLGVIPGLKVQTEKNMVNVDDVLIPNKRTMKAIKEAETGEGCNVYKNSSEMFKSLGINV